MKRNFLAIALMMVICISGCARTLPPHEEVRQAAKKSFEATGLNYSSKSRITNLTVQKKDAQEGADDKNLKYLQTGVEVLQSFSVNADGAIDKKSRRTEVVYDLHYDRDNVEVSVKFPMLFDYGAKTIYFGTSILNTIFNTAFPQAPSTRGKLIRVNLAELLEASPESAKKYSDLIDKDRLNSLDLEKIDNAVRVGILSALAKTKETAFIDQPLTDRDRKAGIARHIRVNLGHSESVAFAVDLIDAVSRAMFQDGIISKKYYSAILHLTDKQSLDSFVNKFIMEMKFEVGVARSGYIGYVDSQLLLADKEGKYEVGLENISSFGSYNAPSFTINPETAGIVDFKDLQEVIKADKAKKQKDSQSNPQGAGVDAAKDSTPAGI